MNKMTQITITHILLILLISVMFLNAVLMAYFIGYFNGIDTGVTIELYNHTISNYVYLG